MHGCRKESKKMAIRICYIDSKILLLGFFSVSSSQTVTYARVKDIHKWETEGKKILAYSDLSFTFLFFPHLFLIFLYHFCSHRQATT